MENLNSYEGWPRTGGYKSRIAGIGKEKSSSRKRSLPHEIRGGIHNPRANVALSRSNPFRMGNIVLEASINKLLLR